MQTETNAVKRMTVECLLREVMVRLDGVIDFWTLVAIGRNVPDPNGFLREHGNILRSLIVVAQAILGGQADEKVASLFGTLTRELEKLLGAFLALERFRTLPLDDVRAATQALSAAYNGVRLGVRQLAVELGFGGLAAGDASQEKDAHLQGILQRLFELCCQERGVHQPVA
jgi:hypothetical protein